MTCRILHIIPSMDWGSAELQLSMLLKHLPTQEFEHHLCTLRRSRLRQSQFAVSSQCLEAARHFSLGSCVTFRKYVRAVRPDIVHSWRHEAWHYAFTGRRFGGPKQLVSLWQFPHPGQLWSWLPRMGRDWQTCLVPHWLAGLKPPHIGYGVAALSRDAIAQQRQAARHWLTTNCGIPNECHILGFIGPWTPQSRIKDVIWAADLLKVVRDDVHVVIAGYGPMRGRLNQFRCQTRTADRVHFIEEPSRFQSVLAALDGLWAPTETATCCHAILEAMARRIPVIASNIAAHNRLIRPDDTGLLVSVGHRAGIAKHALRLLEHKPAADAIAEHAWQHVQQNHSIQAACNSYRDTYRRLASRR